MWPSELRVLGGAQDVCVSSYCFTVATDTHLPIPVDRWEEFSFYINTHFDSVSFIYCVLIPNIWDMVPT